MNICVLGGTGFVGTELVARLALDGHWVRVPTRNLARAQRLRVLDTVELRVADGKAFVKERADLGRAKRSFWHDYKWTDPITRKVARKSTYCERLDEKLFCVGIYKR